MLVEATYSFPKLSVMNGFSVTLAYGSDSGDLLGDNSGMQATVRYQIK
jgi:hypothetical protein